MASADGFEAVVRQVCADYPLTPVGCIGLCVGHDAGGVAHLQSLRLSNILWRSSRSGNPLAR